MEEIKRRVLEKIKPSPEEEREVYDFSSSLKEVAKAIVPEGIPHVCGSTGKGTFLKGDHDIDLFISFQRDEDLKDKVEKFKRIAEEMGGEWEVSYAEHPYLRARIGKFKVDIVPCYRISKGEKPISAVDRSPLHLEFVLENLDDKMKDEVRLLKHFFKSNDLYGSDLKTESISGYVLEVLVWRFKTFEGVLEFFSKMKYGEMVGEASKKFHEPLVVVDPVDPGRNVASALSLRNFIRIRRVSGFFLQNPSEDFRVLVDREPRIPDGSEFIVLKYRKPDLIDDILYPQLRKIGRRLVKHVEMEDLNAFGHFEFCKGEHCFVVLEVQPFQRQRKIIGPPISEKEHVNRFLERHENCSVEDGRVVAIEEREEGSWEEVIRKCLKRIGEFSFDHLSFEVADISEIPRREILKYYSQDLP